MNRKIPFSITIDWLEDKIAKGVCEVTGIKLVYGPGRNVFGPSLDQIKPSKGYTAENTHLVCWMYNAAKSFGTHDDVLNFAKAVINAEK